MTVVAVSAVSDGIKRVSAELKSIKVVSSDLDAALKAGEAAVRRKVKDCLIFVDAAKKRDAAEEAEKAAYKEANK